MQQRANHIPPQDLDAEMATLGSMMLNRQAIEGSVMLDGAPLDQGTIEFAPRNKGGVASGALIDNGTYSIEVAKGLPPGKYIVRIYSARKRQAGQDPPAPPGPDSIVVGVERIPPEYNVKSDRVVEVVADGANSFDFEVPSK